jgi:ATP-dependent protease HslVU (ClpYQ) ATPase subunit
MKTRELNTEEAPIKWWAQQDARMRNLANKSHYSEATRVQVERMKLVLGMVYEGVVYEAYGKKGVSIKVDKAIVKDRKNLRELEAEWDAKGFVKKVSPQGVIYRLTA